MAKDGNGFSFPALIAFSIAGMALAASVVLAYYVTHPKRLVDGREQAPGGPSDSLEL